jgi:energy-coupling factor transporter transmembrane protein EcfT
MIFEYFDRDTVVHRLDPRIKTAWVMLAVIMAVLIREPGLLVLLFGITLLPLIAGRVPRRNLALICLLYLMIAAGATLTQALFYRPSDSTILTSVWLVPPGVPVIGSLTGGILASREGALYGFIQGFRILAVLNMSAVLVLTTPVNRIIVGLRQMGVPATFAFMLTTAVRFVPVLMEEYQTILAALKARNLIHPCHPIRTVELSFAPLIINVIRRCNQLALAAESRAFDLHRQRSSFVSLTPGPADICAGTFTICIVSLFLVASLAVPGWIP